MESYPFIFSNAWRYRLGRHLAFWAFWWLFQGVLYSFSPIGRGLAFNYKIFFSLSDSLVFLIDHMLLSYTLMYFVVPVYLLKNKYLAASAWVILLFVAAGALSAFLANYLIDPVRHWIASLYGIPVSGSESFHRGFFYGLLAGLRGAITIAGLAVAIKLTKYWYIKEHRNMQLQKENMETQLQLLKAQIHPHFLFNTLNNIYAHTQGSSPVASQLVLGLSDMLRYMLYEGDQPFVPLSKELKMIEEYISIEKIRYGNRLELHIDLPEDTGDLYIAPLLLLPFVENCFKHGTSNILEHPWLSLKIDIDDTVMNMKLLNGKPPAQEPAAPENREQRQRIGINNARKRLEFVYPRKHKLTVTDDPDVFIINLRLELERKKHAALQTSPIAKTGYMTESTGK